MCNHAAASSASLSWVCKCLKRAPFLLSSQGTSQFPAGALVATTEIIVGMVTGIPWCSCQKAKLVSKCQKNWCCCGTPCTSKKNCEQAICCLSLSFALLLFWNSTRTQQVFSIMNVGLMSSIQISLQIVQINDSISWFKNCVRTDCSCFLICWQTGRGVTHC